MAQALHIHEPAEVLDEFDMPPPSTHVPGRDQTIELRKPNFLQRGDGSQGDACSKRNSMVSSTWHTSLQDESVDRGKRNGMRPC
jgi:hypothetical protein